MVRTLLEDLQDRSRFYGRASFRVALDKILKMLTILGLTIALVWLTTH